MLSKRNRPRPLIEEVEPRILFSADLAPLVLDTFQPAPEQRVINADNEFSSLAATTHHELVIVDTGVEGYETLLDDILKQAGGDRHVDVVMLDAGRDGIEQIGAALKQYGNLDALHLISHGESGALQLGSSRLDTASLDSRAAEIAAWGTSFNANADLLLYGCDVASGADGEAFLAALSQLTGADVAASTDASGSTTLGGDWSLEASTGSIEASMLLGPTHTVWQGLLNITAAPGQILANTTTNNDQLTTPSSHQVAINPVDDSFIVVWTSSGGQDGANNGIYLRRFDAAGNPLTPEIQVNTYITNNQQNPAIAMDSSGNFVVVWESQDQDGSGYGIYAQRFNANGTTNGAEMQVNTTTANDQTSPSVAMSNTGSFVVTWTSVNEDGSGKGVFARQFSGTWGSAFRVNSTTANDQFDSAVAMNKATGGFVIVWTSTGQDGPGDGVYARLYDSAGNTVRSEFKVNILSAGNQNAADVAMNDAGKFIVAFTDDVLGNPNIAVNSYDATGALQGFVLFPNQYSSGVQQNPSVAIDTSGDFIVVWESDKQDGDKYGIVARHFKANNSAYESEQIINIETNGDQLAPSVAWRGSQAVFLWSGKTTADSKGVSFRLATITSGSNTQPGITSNGGLDVAAVSIAENTTVVTTVTASDADLPAQTLTYSLIGGADQSKFSIIPGTGVLSFVTAPNFEVPGDVGGDNVYEVTVQVSDGNGGTDSQDLSVTVTNVNEAPVASDDTAAGNEDTTILGNVLGNDSDIDSGSLTAAVVSAPTFGSLTLNADGSFSYTPNADWSGTDSFTYTASDGALNSNLATVTLTVNPVNDAPVATDDTAAGNEDTTILGNVLGNDSDIDSGSLTAAVVSAPTFGSLTLNADGSFSYTPNADWSGTDSFTYIASDGSLNSNLATVTLTVNPVNDAPVANNDTAAGNEDTTISGNVLGNDSDIDSGSLTAAVVSAPTFGSLTLNADGSFSYTPNADWSGTDSFTYTASDGALNSNLATVTLTVNPVNDAPVATDDTAAGNEDTTILGNVLGNDSDIDSGSLTAAVVSAPTFGSLTLNADGSFSYTPNADWSGTDSFTYTASDGSLNSNLATVTLTVNPVNDAPVATDDTAAGNEDTTISGNVLGNDSDIDSGSLTAAVVSAPTFGSLTLNADGSFSYTPNADWSGTDSFTYTASDGALNSNVATVTLTVNPVNDAPVATADSVSGNEDTTILGNVLGNDSDIDSGSLTAAVVSAPTFGSLTLNADGSFSYTPNADWSGTDSFTYTASDGSLNSNLATVTLTVNPVNDAPVATADTAAGNEDTTISGNVLGNDSDIDSGSLTAAVVSAPTFGSLTLNADGSFSYTPNADWSGTDSFTYTASDGSLNSNLATVTLTVNPVNDAPVATADSVSGNEDTTILGNVLGNDSDIDSGSLTAAVVSAPTFGSLTLNADGSFSYTPNADWSGTDSFTYIASDGALNSNLASVTLTVNPVSNPVIVIVVELPPTQPAVPPIAPGEPSATPPASGSPQQTAAEGPALGGDVLIPQLVANNSGQEEPTDYLGTRSGHLTPATGSVVTSDSIRVAFINYPQKAETQLEPTLLDALNNAIKGVTSNALALQKLQDSLGSASFQQQLDQVQDKIRQQLSLDRNTVASTLAVSTGLSVGYVLWLVRGGVLLSSLLSSLPAWRLIDPLPILGHLNRQKRGDAEDDSLEGILKKSTAESSPRSQPKDGSAP